MSSLDEVNYEYAKLHLGNVIVLVILFLPGIFGNIQILHFYFFKKPKNSTRVFTLFLAAVDLSTCLIVFPAIMINFSIPMKVTKNFDPLCRLGIYITNVMFSGEAFSLLAIAVDRYQHLCKPFGYQITVKAAKIVCVIIALLAACSAIPVLIIFASTEVSEIHPDAYQCLETKEYRGSLFVKSYYGILLTVGITACSSLIVLYVLIVVRLRQHQANIINRKQSCPIAMGPCQDTEPGGETEQLRGQEIEMAAKGMTNKESEGMSDQSESIQFQTTATSNEEDEVSSENETEILKAFDNNYKGTSHVPLKEKEIKKFNKIKRPIYMFTVVTALYVCSFVLYPLMRWAAQSDAEGMKYPVEIARCFLYLNNVSNSFVYMIFDPVYRQQLKTFYSKIVCRRR
ncbi:hypothetical protein DPMN_095749 [Dreissena polymorpha]|uniref:G-protein coupled receptors family 1 profile domain-containing protein n=1 Tax=Dreissena polymorpha TaxID=45954 RepID=A0A9D4LA31_DREPO|nr:hypothetical protein DPMN_095749 [Dreissena polymorpha]